MKKTMIVLLILAAAPAAAQICILEDLERRVAALEEVVFGAPASPPPAIDWPSPKPGCMVSRPGLQHAPEPGAERFSARIVPPGVSIVSLRLSVDVYVGEFLPSRHDEGRDGLHSLFWLGSMDAWRGYLLGYGNLLGRAERSVRAKLAHSATNEAEPSGTGKRVEIKTGDVIRVEYTWSSSGAQMTITRDEDSWTIRDPKPEPPIFRAVHGVDLFIGHAADEHGPEVVTHGWSYANVCVNFEEVAR